METSKVVSILWAHSDTFLCGSKADTLVARTTALNERVQCRLVPYSRSYNGVSCTFTVADVSAVLMFACAIF